jgi:hypothetical protein
MDQSVFFVASSSKYENLLSKFQKDKKLYTDPDFPAAFSSIIGFGEGLRYTLNSLKAFTWRRPQQIFEGLNLEIFQD